MGGRESERESSRRLQGRDTTDRALNFRAVIFGAANGGSGSADGRAAGARSRCRQMMGIVVANACRGEWRALREI